MHFILCFLTFRMSTKRSKVLPMTLKASWLFSPLALVSGIVILTVKRSGKVFLGMLKMSPMLTCPYLSLNLENLDL